MIIRDTELDTIETISERIISIEAQRERELSINNPRDFDKHNAKIAKFTSRIDALWIRRAHLIRAVRTI